MKIPPLMGPTGPVTHAQQIVAHEIAIVKSLADRFQGDVAWTYNDVAALAHHVGTALRAITKALGALADVSEGPQGNSGGLNTAQAADEPKGNVP